MKWLHNLLKGVSLTGALFVFQACYGVPQSPMYEEEGVAPMTFSLVSHSTGAPLEGIRVLARNGEALREIGTTDAAGYCRVEIPYRRNLSGPFLTFEDPQGKYSAKDTTLADLRDRDILIKMDESR